MKYIVIFLFSLFWAGINVGFSQTVTFVWTERPQAKHHFYAIETDDSANVSFVGVGTCTATIKPSSASLIIYKNNLPIDTLYQNLTYTGNSTNIAIATRIKGEIATYKTIIRVGNSSVTSDSIKAGVVILCNGQSNMVAGSGQTGGITTIPLDPYISSFGTAYFANPAAVTSPNSLKFFLGNPNTSHLAGSLGLNAFYLAKTLKDSLNLPICVLNGSKSATLISEHLKKNLPNVRQDSLSIYGRLLLRVKNAKFQPHHIRAFFWYQGEADALTPTLIANYVKSFNMFKDSLKKDYGNDLPIFVVQIRRECCGRALENVLSLQEIQRNLIHADNVKGVACVNGLAQNTDYCHFKAHSYQKLGILLAKMYCAYKRQIPTTLLFPQPVSAQLVAGNTLIKLLVSSPIDTTQINNCRSFFLLSDGANQLGINSLSAVEDTLFLHFTTALPNPTTSNYRLAYIGSLREDTAAVFSKSGGALLSFNNFKVEINGIYNGTSTTVCNGTPIAGQIMVEKATLCANEATTLSLVGAEMMTGISLKWLYAIDPNSPFSVVPNSGAALSISTGNLTENIFYKVTLTCINTGDSASTVPEGIVVNQQPTIVTYLAQSVICNSTTPVPLMAFGADSYEWSPAIGLSDTVGNIVYANPSYSIAYTVKGTDFEGCVGTAIAAVHVNTPNLWAKAYPVVVCPGGTSKFSVRDSLLALSVEPSNYASSAALASADEDIINVTFSGYLNNNSACGVAATGAGSVASRYSNYTHLTPPTILAGTTINGTITLKNCGNFPYSTGFSIFIDYNRNGIFDLPDERVAEGAPIPSALGNGTVRPFSFTIPLSTFGGVTRMRIVAIQNVDGVEISPENTYLWGETEDYLLRISRTIPTSSYVWSPATIPSVGQIVMTGSMTANTTYTVTATDIEGCIDTANIQLDISNKIVLSPSAPDLVCENTPFTISANAIGGTPMTYSWSNNAGNTDIVTLSLPVGTYTYTVSVNNNCSLVTIDSVTFTVKSKPNVNVTPAAAMICKPGVTNVEVVASGGFNYSWSNSFNLDTLTGDSLILSPPISCTYWVTGENSLGCTDTAGVSLIVGQQVLTDVQNNEIALCPTDSTQLSVSATIAPYSSYCPYFHENGCFGDNISKVVLNTLNYSSGMGCGGDNQYSYFNGGGAQTTQLTAGSTYTLEVSFGYDPYQYFAAWIDYNQDNILNASDYLGASTVNAGSNGTKSITFTVPITAINGTTRLRVIGGSNSPITGLNGCDSSANLFGETEDYDVLIFGGQAPNLQYVWSPTTFLNTTNGNTVQAQNITSPITYTLTTTSLQGCQTLDTINVSFYPNIGNPAGQDINIQPLNCGTEIPLNAIQNGTWSGGNGVFSAINNPTATYLPALSEYNSTVNLVWTMPNFCPHSDTVALNIAAPDSVVAMNIAPSNDSIYKADYELNIGDWTHYYDNHNSPSNECDDYLLLSVMNANTNGNSIGHIGDAGFDMTLYAQSGHSVLNYPTTSYMVYGALWYPMNRYWKMDVLQQPLTDVHLKYYVKDTDVSALQPLVASSTLNDLKFYTINKNTNINYNLNPQNQHIGIPAATPYNYQGNGYWEYNNGTNPTVINWALSNVGNDYAAEIVAGKITGGGAGMGGAFFALPADVLYFDGYNRREGNVLQWRTENEQNSKEFHLMRSEDNVTYTHLATVPSKTLGGMSNIPLDYVSLDSNPYQVTYYQLIHIDIDGTATQSSVIKLQKINDTVFFHALYPNPTHTDINFVLFLNQAAACKIEIVDMAGKIIDTMTTEDLSRGFNTLNIDIRKLAMGAYTAKIINLGDGSSYHAKFFKL